MFFNVFAYSYMDKHAFSKESSFRGLARSLMYLVGHSFFMGPMFQSLSAQLCETSEIFAWPLSLSLLLLLSRSNCRGKDYFLSLEGSWFFRSLLSWWSFDTFKDVSHILCMFSSYCERCSLKKLLILCRKKI